MRAVKKWSIIILIIMLAFSSGCSKDMDGAEGARKNNQTLTRISLWHYYGGKALEGLEAAIDEFNQTEGVKNGVIVESISMGSILELEKNLTEVASGADESKDMPDIFFSYPDKALEIDSYGSLVDLNEYFDEQEKSRFLPVFLKEGHFDKDRFLMLPVAKSTEILYVNETAWNKFASEEDIVNDNLSTWEGLYEASRKYYNWTNSQTPDIPWDGKSLMSFDSVANYIILSSRQLALDIVTNNGDGNGEIVLDHSVLRKVFEIYYKSYSMRYFDAIGRFRSDDVKSQDLTAYIGSTSGAAYFPTWIEDSESDGTVVKEHISFLAMDYPVFKNGNKSVIQQGAGICMGKTNKNSQDGAVVFLKWFTNEKNNVKFALNSDYMPANNNAYKSGSFISQIENMDKDDKTQKNVSAVYKIAYEQLENGATYAPKPFKNSYVVRSILEQSIIEVSKQGREIADGLKAKNLTETEILEGIDVERYFEKWITTLEESFKKLEIAYKRIT